MFESMTDRIAGTVLMGLDVAVEFATLGEFRLVEADASPAPDHFQAAPLVRRPARTTTAHAGSALPPPAPAPGPPALRSPGPRGRCQGPGRVPPLVQGRAQSRSARRSRRARLPD